MAEGGPKINEEWLDWLIQRDYRVAGQHDDEFHHIWRSRMADICSGLPFSRLITAFQKIYRGEIIGKAPLQLQQDSGSDFDDKSSDIRLPDLDMDVIEEILRRLPLRSLMRAKIVCKRWTKAIILGAKLNPLNAEHSEFRHFVMQDMVEGFHGIAFFSSELNRWFRIALPIPQQRRRWSSHLDGHNQLYLCSTAAGFFLFLHRQESLMMIINPVSMQRRELAPLPNSYNWTIGTAVEILAHESAHGHFDIIALGIHHRPLMSNHCILLYNSTARKWTSVPITDHIHIRFWRAHAAWTSVVHDGVFYFTHDYGAHLGCYNIVSMNVQFKRIGGGLPRGIDQDDEENNRRAALPSLVACNGKLLLVGRLDKGAHGGPIYWGRFPFIEHTLVGIWELLTDDNNTWYWAVLSLIPRDLLQHTVESSHGTDFMVAASSDKIWLTIRGSKYLLSLDLRCMEWSVLPGSPAEDVVDAFPRYAVCGTIFKG